VSRGLIRLAETRTRESTPYTVEGVLSSRCMSDQPHHMSDLAPRSAAVGVSHAPSLEGLGAPCRVQVCIPTFKRGLHVVHSSHAANAARCLASLVRHDGFLRRPVVPADEFDRHGVDAVALIRGSHVLSDEDMAKVTFAT